MICFPNAKINIGLDVLKKRKDNYHDLETLFYPIQLCDILEINYSEEFHFNQTGILLDSNDEDNLVVKAFQLLDNVYHLPNVNIHLHKQIPFGAGLGGGSSDAAFTLLTLNQLFDLKLNQEQLLIYAGKLGSDCPFFVLNRPVFASGRGDQFNESELSLKDYSLVLVKPGSKVSTAEAYCNIQPVCPDISLLKILQKPVADWKKNVRNCFEQTVFPVHSDIKIIKDKFYFQGAIFASMSGSGSSVFGLFDKIPDGLNRCFPDCFYWEETCKY